MRMVFKQRFFSWLDSYDIYDVEGATLYTVEGKMSFGHCLQVMDAAGNHVGTLKEKVFRFLPQFEIYIGDVLRGSVQKEFSFLTPKFHVDFNGWQVREIFWSGIMRSGTHTGGPWPVSARKFCTGRIPT